MSVHVAIYIIFQGALRWTQYIKGIPCVTIVLNIHDKHALVLYGLGDVIEWRARSGHEDVIKWKQFPRYWPFVRGIHRSPVNSPHKGQWRGALMFSLICARISGWVNNPEAGDLKRHPTHCDVIVMWQNLMAPWVSSTCFLPFCSGILEAHFINFRQRPSTFNAIITQLWNSE